MLQLCGHNCVLPCAVMQQGTVSLKGILEDTELYSMPKHACNGWLNVYHTGPCTKTGRQGAGATMQLIMDPRLSFELPRGVKANWTLSRGGCPMIGPGTQAAPAAAPF